MYFFLPRFFYPFNLCVLHCFWHWLLVLLFQRRMSKKTGKSRQSGPESKKLKLPDGCSAIKGYLLHTQFIIQLFIWTEISITCFVLLSLLWKLIIIIINRQWTMCVCLQTLQDLHNFTNRLRPTPTPRRFWTTYVEFCTSVRMSGLLNKVREWMHEQMRMQNGFITISSGWRSTILTSHQTPARLPWPVRTRRNRDWIL